MEYAKKTQQTNKQTTRLVQVQQLLSIGRETQKVYFGGDGPPITFS